MQVICVHRIVSGRIRRICQVCLFETFVLGRVTGILLLRRVVNLVDLLLFLVFKTIFKDVFIGEVNSALLCVNPDGTRIVVVCFLRQTYVLVLLGFHIVIIVEKLAYLYIIFFFYYGYHSL